MTTEKVKSSLSILAQMALGFAVLVYLTYLGLHSASYCSVQPFPFH